MPKVTEQVTELGLPAPVGTRRGPQKKGCFPLLRAARRPAQGRKSGRGAGTGAHGREAAGTRGAFPSARGLGHAGRAAHGGGVRTAGPEAAAGARGLAGSGAGCAAGGQRCAGGADRGRPAGAPRSRAAGLRSRSPTCGLRGPGARANPAVPPPPGSPSGPRSVLRLQATAAGTARAQGEAGPAGCSEEGAGPPGAAQNPLSSPRPRPAPPRGRPRPLAGDAGGSEGHATRSLLCVRSRRRPREQGRAK